MQTQVMTASCMMVSAFPFTIARNYCSMWLSPVHSIPFLGNGRLPLERPTLRQSTVPGQNRYLPYKRSPNLRISHWLTHLTKDHLIDSIDPRVNLRLQGALRPIQELQNGLPISETRMIQYMGSLST